MSELLKRFLSEWLAWVEEGATDEDPFCRYQGLCSNFGRWLFGVCDDYDQMERENDQLKALFVADGLDEDYPFGGWDAYFDDGESESMHLNERRISWVRSKVAQYEVV